MEYFVSPTGNNGNAGTLASPWRSWHYGFNLLNAGDTLWVRGGTYSGLASLCPASGTHRYGVLVSGRNGTAANHITVKNYQNEVPILDGSYWNASTADPLRSSIIGLRMNSCNYWDVTGLEIKNFLYYADNDQNCASGWLDSCTNMTFNRISAHDNGNGWEIDAMGSNSNYLYWNNCDTYQCHDRFIGAGGETPGGLANGWHSGLDAGSHIFFNGCRAWSCSDDGWDFFGSAGFITWINCWGFSNGDGYGGVVGDGSGFKMGPITTAEAGNQRVLYNCLAFDNTGIDGRGFDQNQAGAPFVPKQLYNCSAYNNMTNYQFWTQSGSLIRNCLSLDGPLKEQGDDWGDSTLDHNGWQGGLITSAADFVSVLTAQAKGARQANGDLPVLTLLHLTAGSDLINAGDATAIYATDGDGQGWDTPPSIGAFEFNGTPPIPPAVIAVTGVTVVGAGSQTVITTPAGTLQMSAHIDPHNATDQTVVWSVANGTGSASISASGLLTAITNGTVTVKATSNG